jgi:histone H3/H4
VPTNLTISSNPQSRNLSDDAVSLLVTLVDHDLSRVFDLANTFRITAAGRETLFASDLEKAIDVINARY